MNDDPIKVKNPQEEREHGNPIFQEKPDLGDERRAAEITETNERMDQALGFDPASGEKETRLEDAGGPDSGIGDGGESDSRSAEQKAQDVLNGGVLRI